MVFLHNNLFILNLLFIGEFLASASDGRLRPLTECCVLTASCAPADSVVCVWKEGSPVAGGNLVPEEGASAKESWVVMKMFR